MQHCDCAGGAAPNTPYNTELDEVMPWPRFVGAFAAVLVECGQCTRFGVA